MAIVNGEYGLYDDGQSEVVMPDSAYIVRGNYRMPRASFGGAGASGPLEVMGANGWEPVTAVTAPSGYDPRQDSNAAGSNERLRFNHVFGSAPANVPITQLQQYAMANGWQEPDRSNNEGTLGAMFSSIAPYAGLMLGGVGAMGGLGGLFGGANAGALAAGDAMAGLIPAGEGFGGAGMLGDSAAWGLGEAAGSGSTLGGSAMDWTDALGDWTNWGDTVSSSGGLFDTTGIEGLVDSVGNITQAGKAQLASNPGLFDQLKTWMAANPGSTAKMGLQALSGLMKGVGGYLSGNAATSAAKTTADAQIAAAKIAAEAAKFKPIGVTTRFGSSNFQKDADGNVIGAGYTLSPEMKAQQDALMGISGNMLTQYQNGQAAFAPMGVAGQRAMSLGNQYLATDPQAQALKYMQDQQALLATGRNRDMSNMLTGEFNRGTYGLATGGTGQMGAANPRLEALLNAQRQQDLGLAAQATQGGMDYAKFGTAMSGLGGDLTKGMFSGQQAAYAPYQTALQGAQYIEGLGQQPLTMGIDMGKQMSNAASGGLLAQGMTNAANTINNTAQIVGSQWGNLLTGTANDIQNYQKQQQQQQQQQALNDALIAKIWSS